MASFDEVVNDQANGARLSRLLINKGAEAFRQTLDSLIRHHCHSTLAAVLIKEKTNLKKLRYRVMNADQWKLLYPPSGPPDPQKFDITLLTILLRNICGLTAPATGWDALPPVSDTSIAANIARIKYYRNEVHAHITTTEIPDNEFENLWKEISDALIVLGISKSDLDELKKTPLSLEEANYITMLEDWHKKEDDLIKIALETNTIVKEVQTNLARLEKEFQNSRKTDNVSEVDKLCKCDFTGIISSMNKNFLNGTREWLFGELDTWFNDKDSNSQVMILTAGPGVGKSTFAAEVCRRYTEKGQLAACHFCRYNNSDKGNPRKIIESLASHMCDNVADFKDKLLKKLQRNHSKETLSDAFCALLNDPLYALGESEPVLLVIDALDESEVEGKSEFLELISKEFPGLPQSIKILITSRPELPVQERLQHLNPLNITPGDKNNENDILKYFQHFLLPICNDDLVLESLARECQGSFLFAFYTKKELERTTTQLTKDDIMKLVPKGIDGFYKQQFERLRSQLKTHCSSDIDMKAFLEVLVVAKGPLPLSLLPECLGLHGNTEFEVREAISEVTSSILPVYDNCLTLYHKSLRDWLLSDGYREHAFTVGSKNGHVRLWKACKNMFEEIISSNDLCNFKSSSVLTRYALANGIFHMIQCGREAKYHLAVHVKIVHGRTMIKPFQHYNMKKEWLEIVNNSLLNLSAELLQDIKWHITLFERISGENLNPSFYLQRVVNNVNCSSEKRSLARLLLQQGQYFWFEDLDAKLLTKNLNKSVPLRTDVTCLSVSQNEQLVAVGYKDGWISIFSVPDFKELHIFDTMPETNIHRSTTFSPDKCNHLHKPYMRSSCDNWQPPDNGAVCSSSFSQSGNRLVTSNGSKEVKLWDVKGQKLLARMEAGGPVNSCSFSECGLFIVASSNGDNVSKNQADVFTVWNVLTRQRVDQRNISNLLQLFDPIGGVTFTSSLLILYETLKLPHNVHDRLLLSRNGEWIDLFQLPKALHVARLYAHLFPSLLPVIEHHKRDCVLYHKNQTLNWIECNPSYMMKIKYWQGWFVYMVGSLEYNFGCPCCVLKSSSRIVSVKVQRFYMVAYFNKLNIFSLSDCNSKSIQPSFISEPCVINCCCFSPDASFLATCDSHSILIWDTKICTIVHSIQYKFNARSCWWSGNWLWLYDHDSGELRKLPISNGRFGDLSQKQSFVTPWKLLTYSSDILIFIDDNNCACVRRISNGEIQCIEPISVVLSAAVSPSNSVILTANLKTFQVWKEGKTEDSFHWVPSNAVEFTDHLVPSKIRNIKCCITTDGTKGVLALHLKESFQNACCYTIVELESSKILNVVNSLEVNVPVDILYANNSYCIGVGAQNRNVLILKFKNGEVVAGWINFRISAPILAVSKNDLLAVISTQGCRIQFLKIIAPH